MSKPRRLLSPAFALAAIALFVALGSGVYAASRIDGHSIRVRSLPGNRLKPHSVAASRLRPGLLGRSLHGPLTGDDIDERSLGQVPNAAYAEAAGMADSAVDAENAVNAVNAVDATTVNGHTAGCFPPETIPFAGACWQAKAAAAMATAPVAAATCAAQGGSLPEALQLAAFTQQPGVEMSSGEEWTADITNVSGLATYGVVTVSAAGELNFSNSTTSKRYRCVIPLVA